MLDAFVAEVRRTIARGQMMDARERLVVAVSGGADSVALLAVLHELGHPLVAAHLNHGWRGAESDRDQEFVRRLAESLDLPFVVEGWPDTVERRGGPEQRARDVRYEFLLRAARDRGCRRIATGHTRDDQAETVLLRLLRGSGLGGLAGILPRRRDGVVRPLLDVSRADVLAYLARRGLAHIEDSSNLDLRFTRNRVRLLLLPHLRRLEPEVDRRLAAMAAMALSARRQERTFAAALLRDALDPSGSLDLRRLEARSPAVRRLAVRAWLRRVRGDVRQIGRVHLEAVAGCGRSGTRVEVPGGAVTNEHGRLRYTPNSMRAADALPPAEGALALAPGTTVAVSGRWHVEASGVQEVAGDVALPPDLWHAVVDADRCNLPLQVRAWRFGDRIRPLGMVGTRKLSDVFGDAKLPRWQRSRVPIVTAGDAVLWIPGIARSSATLVDGATRRVIRLRAWQSSAPG